MLEVREGCAVVSHRLRVSTCGRCGATTVTGDCNLNVSTTVDPAPISVAGEALAILTRRRVLDVARVRGMWRIFHRPTAESIHRLRGDPFAHYGSGIVAAHVCWAPLPVDAEDPNLADLVDPPPDLATALGLPPARLDPPF